MTILQLLLDIFSRKLQGTRQMLPLFFFCRVSDSWFIVTC